VRKTLQQIAAAGKAAKAQAPWHPCDDGLIPMAEALERCSRASVLDLPERIKYQSTAPSHVLGREINSQTTLPGLKAPPRVEMVRRWLQTNGLAPDGQELQRRWVRISRGLQRWEQAARRDIAPPKSNAMFCSETTCDDYYRVIELVDDMADWCRQLAWMLTARLKTTQQMGSDEKGQGDTKKGQKKPRPARPLNDRARKCLAAFNRRRDSGQRVLMAQHCREFAAEERDSGSLYRTLKDWSHLWRKRATKRDTKRDKTA
jgi:hypothetical protein